MDLATLIARSWGMIVNSTATFESDGRGAPPWSIPMRQHVLPLIVLSAALSTVLILMFGVPALDLAGPESVLDFVIVVATRIISEVLIFLAVAKLVSAVSGLLGGRGDFDSAVVFLALAFTPIYLGNALMGIPLVGLLAAPAGTIYAFVLTYRGAPICLDLPTYARGRFVGAVVLGTFAASLMVQSLIGGVVMIG